MITRAEAVALTELLRTIRPAWDALTTINILAGVPGDIEDVTSQAIRAARNPQVQTPKGILFEQPAHRPVVSERTPVWMTSARLLEIHNCPHCDDRGRIPNGYLCQHDDPQVRAARVKAWADKARAQIRPAPNQQETA